MTRFLLTATLAVSISFMHAAGYSRPATTTTTVTKADQVTSLPATVIPSNRKGTNKRFNKRHGENLQRIKDGPIDLLFLGDSITDRWSREPDLWKKYFGKWNPANFGIGGDRTENIIWRINHGELDGISPKVVVLMIGTNNTHSNSVADIVLGIRTIIDKIQAKLPETKILLLAVFPREFRMKDGEPYTMPKEKVALINKQLPGLAEEENVRYLDLTDEFLVDGKVPEDIMPDTVHPNRKGYVIWGDAITPVLEEMMSPEAQ